ncbi:hypothetical protein L8V01_10845 [Corynebacterium sp. c8Ua_181]|uniref:Uncharacterized protein n=1 Tax=Corynebacterium curieae TaxID=2913500 RepID=A0A9X3MCW8_9CORY|nr:hypothetical protein [Corynebacterium curieae]MCZ9307966.1 hypothetical protein [Corynebacterium curieae]
MTDFRAFNSCTGETFYAGGGMVARHRAWELATIFVTTDPRWEYDEAVHLVIKDAEARNDPSFYTAIDLRQVAKHGHTPVSIELRERQSTD